VGWEPAVTQPMGEVARNGSGIGDTACVLGVSPTTVMTTLKKTRRRGTRSTPRWGLPVQGPQLRGCSARARKRS
jgi:hypothetical protein